MGGARTKMDENSEYASGEYAGRHSLSPQHSVLSTIFVGDPQCTCSFSFWTILPG
jgi:hypothetical protein